jgi:hypothetical protein
VTVALPSNVTIADAAAGQVLAAGTVDFVVKTNTSTSSGISASTTWAASNNTVTISLAGADTIIAGDVATITVNVTASTTAGAAQNIAVSTSQDTTAANVTIQVIPAAANRFASVVDFEETTAKADGSAEMNVDVYVYDQYYNPVPDGTKVFIVTDRDATDTVTAETGYTQNAKVGKAYSIDTKNGMVEFKLTSNIVGSPKVAIGLTNTGVDELYNYLIGTIGATADAAGLISTQVVEFTAASTGSVTVTTDAAGTEKANGVDDVEVTATVRDGGGNPMRNVEVTFSVDKAGLTFNKTSVMTDAVGKAKVKVTATKTGTFTVKAKADDKSGTATVTFGTPGAFDIKLKKGDAQKVAKGSNPDAIAFEVTDINGNKVTTGTLPTFEVTEKPDGSNVAIGAGSWDATDEEVDVTWTTAPDKEGTYVIRASLANGKAATATLEVKEQGDITSLELKYDEVYIAEGGNTTGTPTIKYVDAEGIKKTVSLDTGIHTFSISNPSIATINPTTGVVISNNDDKYGTVTVTLVDSDKDLVATFDILVGTKPVAFTLTPDKDVYAPGETAVVTLQLVDADGNKIADTANVTMTDVVLSKPADAIVEVSYADLDDTDEDGSAKVKVTSNVAGEVKVHLVATTTLSGNLANTLVLNFAEEKPVVTYGAKNVTMFISSTGYVQDGSAKTMDQAPFIQDNRTFVPVRMVGEALGAEVEYDAATQVITLTRPDMTITMTIGSNVLVKSDGTSVVSDVAPFIVAETGRTVIPFRAIAEAFGATVEAVFAADGTVTAVTFQQ